MSNELTGVIVLSLMFGVVALTLFMVQHDIRNWYKNNDTKDT